MENETERYTTEQSAQERGLSTVPLCYELPTSQRPTLKSPIAHVPVIDITGLRMGPAQRSSIIHSIGQACRRLGFFHVSVSPSQFIPFCVESISTYRLLYPVLHQSTHYVRILNPVYEHHFSLTLPPELTNICSFFLTTNQPFIKLQNLP